MAQNNANHSGKEELSNKIVKPIKLPKVSKAVREKKLKDQITLLNDIVKVRLAPSTIQGIGVFAMRDMKKGEKLYTDIIPHQFDLPFIHFKKLDQEIREILLGHFPLIVKGSHFLYPVTKFSAYLNHAETPNYDAVNDKLLVDVKRGDEITENYRLIDGYKKVFPWLAIK